jgi:hypothetical protein
VGRAEDRGAVRPIKGGWSICTWLAGRNYLSIRMLNEVSRGDVPHDLRAPVNPCARQLLMG